jgi:hypothetical protein
MFSKKILTHTHTHILIFKFVTGTTLKQNFSHKTSIFVCQRKKNFSQAKLFGNFHVKFCFIFLRARKNKIPKAALKSSDYFPHNPQLYYFKHAESLSKERENERIFHAKK